MSDTNNGMDVSRNSFIEMPPESKLNILFDLSVCMNMRLRELEKSKWINKILSIICGIIAGVGVVATKLYGGF